jgi:tripartite ATP-independent transporter DctP family solute receptor
MKKTLVLIVAMSIILTGVLFAGGQGEAAFSSTASAAAPIVIQVGFENSMAEPIGQGFKKWQELVAAKGDGSIKLELFPDSQLGSKNSLIDSMLLGEPVVTLADGAFYADYGVKDFGIVFGPFLFDNWDQCWVLTESDWYKQQSAALEAKGLKLLASNYVYGARHTLTTKPIRTIADLKGMKIRVPSNQIQSIGMDVLGAISTGMSLGDVYQALQTGTIDGAENPLSTLYGRKLHEVAKYLILDGHVLNFTTLVTSADFFKSLTKAQQDLLLSTAHEAGVYNNELAADAEQEYLDKMLAEGVILTEMSPQLLKDLKSASEAFYSKGATFGWSDGLYARVKAAMGAK